MKKMLLILGLMSSIQMETKAQQDKQSIAAVERNLFESNSFATGNPGPERDADFYLHRSRKQRTVGWITLGAGVALSTVGLLIAANNEGTYIVDAYGNTYGDDNTVLATTLTVAGALSGIVSIPFMIMASVNKHKATLMLKNQQTGLIVPPGFNRNIPGISVSIPIGK